MYLIFINLYELIYKINNLIWKECSHGLLSVSIDSIEFEVFIM